MTWFSFYTKTIVEFILMKMRISFLKNLIKKAPQGVFFRMAEFIPAQAGIQRHENRSRVYPNESWDPIPPKISKKPAPKAGFFNIW